MPTRKSGCSKGHGEKRSRLEGVAIAALVSARTIGEAAKQVGVSERTLKTWMQDPVFAEKLQQARAEVFRDAIAGIQAAATEAVATLQRNMKCGDPRVEVQAARVVLDCGLKTHEVFDQDERLKKLEAALAELEGRERR